jgi:hypothetical protein
MTDSVSSQPFRVLAASLKEGEFAARGIGLENILAGTWTTSTELVHELGGAVLAIRDQCRPLSADQKALIKQCLREVRKAWPGFGWARRFGL